MYLKIPFQNQQNNPSIAHVQGALSFIEHILLFFPPEHIPQHDTILEPIAKARNIYL